MAKRTRSQEDSVQSTVESQPASAELASEETKVVETIEANTEPAQVNLQVEANTEPAPARSPEEIMTSVQERLARKTDLPTSNPFIPALQLDNEVKSIANTKGFPLSRGTEIGARLMARSNRKPQ